MKVFAISDLHLSINNPKPMDIFGPVWDNYINKIVFDWNKKVKDEDVVLMAGDLSWAMKLEDAKKDIDFLDKLNGKKIIIKGNHDYWWSTISKVRNILPKNFFAIQNDSLRIENYIFCGTRGWMDENSKLSESDKKIVERELIRLRMTLESATKQKGENDEIICMMHYPPFDKNNNRTRFTDIIEEFNVKTVIYGHLHGKIPNAKKVFKMNGVTYFLTSCDMIDNELIEIK